MTVMQAIKDRRSVRHYAERPIEEEVLAQVLEAGRLAPSATNRQEWKFVVARDPAKREALSAACCNQKMVAEAPATLIVCATAGGAMPCGQLAETVDCSIAMSFMMLEAAELGLGACWLGAFKADAVKDVLGLPEDYTPVVVSPLGYPAEQPDARPRKALEEVVEYR